MKNIISQRAGLMALLALVVLVASGCFVLGEYEDDVRWWERRLQQLQDERETEPDRAAKRYELRSLRVFPLGVLYLLPESLLRGGGA